MAYMTVIVIFDAFAKKNVSKIRFENKEEITTVVPLLYFYMKENEKNHNSIHFIIMYPLTHVMYKKTTTIDYCNRQFM